MRPGIVEEAESGTMSVSLVTTILRQMDTDLVASSARFLPFCFCFLAFLGYGDLNISFNTMTDVPYFSPSTWPPNHPSIAWLYPSHQENHTHTHRYTPSSSHIPVPLNHAQSAASESGDGWAHIKPDSLDPSPPKPYNTTQLDCMHAYEPYHTGFNSTVLSVR